MSHTPPPAGAEKKFTGLALEANWNDAARLDRYVRGQSTDRTAVEPSSAPSV